MMVDKKIGESMQETWKHIDQVRRFLQVICRELVERGGAHDRSKLESPEVEFFAEYTPKLAGCTYGGDEYKQFLQEMKPALDHHYAHNRHHPEHFLEEADATFRASPVNCMNLIDVIEMFCDWKAATLRHNDGDLRKSIEINAIRFEMSKQLVSILINSIGLFEGEDNADTA